MRTKHLQKTGFGGKLGKSHEGLGTAKLGELVATMDHARGRQGADEAANQYKSRDSSAVAYQ